MSTTAVAGHGPLSFTDASGRQRFVPLSALQVEGSKLELESHWTGASGIADAVDQAKLLAVAAERLATGELFAPPKAPPSPAILFTAAVPGAAGNDITVTVSPGTGNAVTAKVAIRARAADVYAGLTDGAAAKARIGVDDPGTSSDPAGTGIVMVKESGPIAAGLPKDGQSLTVKNDTAVLAEDGTTTLFTLVPRPGAPAAGVPVTVAVDPSSSTFTLTASFDTGSPTPIPLGELTTLPAPLPFLISASPPPRGVAVPAGGDLQLSGGAAGVAATATAYTS